MGESKSSKKVTKDSTPGCDTNNPLENYRIPRSAGPKGQLRLPTDQLPTITGNFHDDNLPSFFEEAERVLRFHTCGLPAAGYSAEQIDLFKIQCVHYMVGKANTTPASRSLSNWIRKQNAANITITFNILWNSPLKDRHWSNEYKAHWRSRIQKAQYFDARHQLLSNYLNEFFKMSEMADMSNEEAYTALKDKVREDVKLKLDNYWDRYKDIHEVHNQVQANDVGTLAKASIALAQAGEKRTYAAITNINYQQQDTKRQRTFDADDNGPCQVHHRIPPGSQAYHKHGDCDTVRKQRGLQPVPRTSKPQFAQKGRRNDGKPGYTTSKTGVPPRPCNLCGSQHWQSDCPYLAAAKASAIKDKKYQSTNAITVSLNETTINRSTTATTTPTGSDTEDDAIANLISSMSVEHDSENDFLTPENTHQ